MIAYSEIDTESLKLGIPAAALEKDYHLDWYLTALWGEALFPDFFFYGATAIKKLLKNEKIAFTLNNSKDLKTFGHIAIELLKKANPSPRTRAGKSTLATPIYLQKPHITLSKKECFT